MTVHLLFLCGWASLCAQLFGLLCCSNIGLLDAYGNKYRIMRAYAPSHTHSAHTVPLHRSATVLYGADPGIDLTPSEADVDLDIIGQDIQVLPPQDGNTKIVMKFGGSSVSNAERVTYVAKLIKKHCDAGYKPIIVVSAMGKTTNSLLSSAQAALKGEVYIESLRNLHISTAKSLGLSIETFEEIEGLLKDLSDLLNGVKMLGELSPRTKDALTSFGERMSVRVLAGTLAKYGLPAQAFDSWTLGMLTTSEFGNAEVLEETFDNIRDNLAKYDWSIIPVVTGFIGHDENGRITTLGRGGSDLTATVIGAAAPADEIQVWKDVDGILTTDPRIVKGAVPVDAVTYEEAAELAYFGAEVLHPIAMQPAQRTKIPVRVKNSYNPIAVGTCITFDRDKEGSLVTAITAKASVQLVDIVSTRMLGQYGFLGRVFQAFDRCEISVDVIASSEVSLSLTLDQKQTERTASLKNLINDLGEFSDVQLYDERAIISLISNVKRAAETMAITFRVMEKLGVKLEMLSQGASKVNISLVVKMKDKDRLMKALHACFFEGVNPEDLNHDSYST